MSTPRSDRARAVLARGADMAGQVGTAAAEVVRARRDPTAVATRQVTRARRRTVAWSVGGLATGGWAGAQIGSWVTAGVSASVVVWLILCTAVLAWVVPGLVRSVRDLVARKRTLALLPPPQPSRPAVPGLVRPQMQRLGQLSDGLRSLVGMIGWVDDDTVLALRSDLIEAADAAEVRLRRTAAGLTGVLRARDAAAPDHRAAAQQVVDQTVAVIDAGVEEYARLVAAATETAAASSVSPAGELAARADQLSALARGMREITAG